MQFRLNYIYCPLATKTILISGVFLKSIQFKSLIFSANVYFFLQIGDYVVFLCSPAADNMTGLATPCDGGYSIVWYDVIISDNAPSLQYMTRMSYLFYELGRNINFKHKRSCIFTHAKEEVIWNWKTCMPKNNLSINIIMYKNDIHPYIVCAVQEDFGFFFLTVF